MTMTSENLVPTCFLRFRLLPADASRPHQRSVLEQMWRLGDYCEWRLVPRVDERGDPAPLEAP